MTSVKVAADHDDESCRVCADPESFIDNPIVLCDGCNRGVHQDCFDIPQASVDAEHWYCPECLAGNHDNQCVLCPIKDDQEMRIPSTRNVHDLVSWAHQLCAVWHPQLSVVDQQVVGLGQNSMQGLKKLICEVCKTSNGLCCQCSEKCYKSFHPLCALRSNYKFDCQIGPDGRGQTIQVLCGKHSNVDDFQRPPSNRKSRTAGNFTLVPVVPQAIAPADANKNDGTTSWSNFAPIAHKWIKIPLRSYPFTIHCRKCDETLLEKGCERDLEPERGSQAIWTLLKDEQNHHFTTCSMKAVGGLTEDNLQARAALCLELDTYLAIYRRPDPGNYADWQTELRVPVVTQETIGRPSRKRTARQASESSSPNKKATPTARTVSSTDSRTSPVSNATPSASTSAKRHALSHSASGSATVKRLRKNDHHERRTPITEEDIPNKTSATSTRLDVRLQSVEIMDQERSPFYTPASSPPSQQQAEQRANHQHLRSPSIEIVIVRPTAEGPAAKTIEFLSDRTAATTIRREVIKENAADLHKHGLRCEDDFRLFTPASWEAFLQLYPQPCGNSFEKGDIRRAVSTWLAHHDLEASDSKHEMTNYLNRLSAGLGDQDGVLSFLDQIGCSSFAQLNRISTQAWREVVQEKDGKSWSSNALPDHLKFLLAYLIEQDKSAKERKTGV